MRFVLFFDEKEGTSPIVRLLDNFTDVEIVHQSSGRGWEPFDRHNCGEMSIGGLRKCLTLVLGPGPVDMDALNKAYMRSATYPLSEISGFGVVGFKMRFQPPALSPTWLNRLPIGGRVRGGLTTVEAEAGPFRPMMMEVLRTRGVHALVAVRTDILRWALSKYHGDGSGRPGHLQFSLASGEITRDQIPKIHVDCQRLGRLVRRCYASHARKRRLLSEFARAGIPASVVIYEDFVADPARLLADLLVSVGRPTTQDEAAAAVTKGTCLIRVHSADISEFVTNHFEVMEKFGGDVECAW